MRRAVPLVLLVLTLTGCAVGRSPMPTTTVTVPAPSTSTAPTLPAEASPEPALVDTAGRALPVAVADGVRRIDAALATDDVAALEPLYVPADAAAGWTTVASRLTDSSDRIQLLRALRNPPEARPEISYLYSEGDHGLGITDAGRLAFVGVGQKPAAGPAPVDLASYGGRWNGHGRSILFGEDGRGVLDFRTYTSCPSDRAGVPCEPDGPAPVGQVVLQLAADAGSVTGRVVDTNDEPDYPVGRNLTVSSDRTGVLLLGTGADQFGLCREGVDDDSCGA